MATWALVLSLVPICLGNLVAIGLAIEVLGRCRDGRNHGKGQAIAALVVAPVWLLLFGVLVVAGLTEQADRDASGVVTGRGDVSVFALEVGDCLPGALAETEDTRTVEVGPCSEPHYGEVFADFDLADGSFPGVKEVQRLAEGGCTKRIDEYVEEGRDLTNVELYYFYPLEDTWAYGHTISCIARTTSPSTGTLKGTES